MNVSPFAAAIVFLWVLFFCGLWYHAMHRGTGHIYANWVVDGEAIAGRGAEPLVASTESETKDD